MFTRYSYASERSTNPLESAISLGGGGGGMFPGTINPGVHDAGSFGQSQLFGSDSIHGEVEPAIMGEPQHQANFVPIVHNFAVSLDHANTNYSDTETEIFFPKGTLVSIGQKSIDSARDVGRPFNAPGTKPKHNYVFADGMKLQGTIPGDDVRPKNYAPFSIANAMQGMFKLPLAEGTFLRPHAPVNYMAVCVADTATIHVPKPITPDAPGSEGTMITRQGAVGDFPAGTLVYAFKSSYSYNKCYWTDIILSFDPIPRDAYQFLGVLRVPYTAGMGTETELSVALSPARPPFQGL